ncbi:probable glucan endo-1,3-beta-glucosidase eglC [Aspergillus udagawae]|nr:probable glucan endo-1,3-beta-glucosidase eglC [Aspergillus udagawae]
MHFTRLVALALALATSEAAHQGFNYGSTKSDGSAKSQSDFQSEFSTAKNLVGTSGFTSARLYTMIQGGTPNTPISAIPAAVAEETSLLLGLWASGGNFANEIAALKSAIAAYGDDLAKLVVGISVGSEDLYRNSVDGVKANAGLGTNPDELVSYINQVRSTIAGTKLSGAPIGHVDTWTAWVNRSNSAVVDACDWLGFDGYPYFQNTMANSISDAKALFDDSVAKTQAVAKGKEVWITETGWPVSGKTENLAVANLANAKTYWDEVGCPLFGKTNTWWYILQDANPVTPNPSFGIVGSTLSTTPLFDLSCSASSSSAAASSTPAPSASSVAGGKASGFTTAVSSGSAAASSGAAGSAKPTFTVGKGPGGSYNGSYAGSWNSSSSARPSSSAISGSSSGSSSSGSSGSSGSGASGQSSSSTGSSSSPSSSTNLSNSANGLSGSIFGAVVAVCLALAAL